MNGILPPLTYSVLLYHSISLSPLSVFVYIYIYILFFFLFSVLYNTEYCDYIAFYCKMNHYIKFIELRFKLTRINQGSWELNIDVYSRMRHGLLGCVT